MSKAYEMLFAALTEHGSTSRDVRQTSSMWQCPSHPDKNPSLKIDDKGDRVLIHCHGHCHTDDVLASLGLSVKDLFDNDLTASPRSSLYGQLVRSYLYEVPNGDPWFWVDRYYPKSFRQRLPGVEPVRDLSDKQALSRLGLRVRTANGMQTREPVVYHAPKAWLAGYRGERTIWWLDGEKDVEAAEKDGHVATCAPGFAKWRPQYATALHSWGFTEVVMVVDQDKDKGDGTLGAGAQVANAARLGFRAVGMKVRIVAPAAGKDYSDHRAAGFGPNIDDFDTDVTVAVRPRGMSAALLVTKKFEPIEFVIDHILPTGLTIIAGSPKVGKSWVTLDWCCAVGSGGRALGYLQALQGNALLVAREDSYRRLQSRLALIMGGDLDQVPADLEIVPADVDWVGGEEGIGHLTEWADEVANPRLVVLDTLGKVEPELGETDRRGNAYTGNYSMMARYKNWADQRNIAVVAVHHDRKGGAGSKEKMGMNEDPFTKISGTRGLTGAADTLMFLETVRGSGAGDLHITGRDVPTMSLELHKTGPLWQAWDVPRGE
jgi:hypothetical protein